MKLRHLSWPAAAVLLAAASAAGAADARLVNLNAIATDSHGQPVADLAGADFQVSDSGKPQNIAFFRMTPVGAQPLTAPGPGEFSNRSGGKFPHTTLIVLDLLNSQMSDRGFSSAEIARNLQGLETSDSLYFYLLTRDSTLFPVHGLPGGPADVKPESTPWVRKIKPLLDDGLQKVNKLRPGDRTIDVQVRNTYAVLNQVVSALALMPGRNSLIWISHGVPIAARMVSGDDYVRYTPFLQQLVAACERARTTVYTVDPSGILSTDDLAMASADTLQQLAGLTGGVTYRADALAAATRLAMGDGRANYRIEYAPPADGWDGKLHKVRVTCARKGVNLQVKQSYYADAPAEGERDRAALQSAVSSPFDNPDLGLRVLVSPGKTAQSLRFRVLVDPADALATHAGDRYAVQMDIAFVQFTAEGPKSVSKPVVAKVSLTQEQYDTALKNGIPLDDEELPVGADIRKVRVIVYDRGSDLAGSVTVPSGGQ
jgi:VWFA-related protein